MSLLGSVLEISNVSFTYRSSGVNVTALNDVSLAVDAGEMVAVVGASGSGKSTLLATAGGLLKPDSGSVRIAKTDMFKLSEAKLAKFRRENIGFVFQEYNLLRTLTVEENITLVSELNGSSRLHARNRAAEIMDQVGLNGMGRRYPSQLSGGQQQRVAVARALIDRPSVILADEPTGAVDTANTTQILELLNVVVDTGVAVLLITHDTGVAKEAGRILVMTDGNLQSFHAAERTAS